jgi:glycosyltransferase involved in cell wall biosynthesis
VVLAVGKLKRRKGFSTLLRAFARLRARRDARLIVLGEGEERPHLETLAAELGIRDAVDLHGFADNPLAYMARSDVFVLPSEWEGLPTVLIEALVCGCPVVSTDCPSGPAEILDHGRYGTLVPVGDEEALADAILATLAQAPPAALLRERASMFDVERSAACYLELLRG